MQVWLASILADVIKLLTEDLITYLKKVWANFQRLINQDSAAKKVEENQGKPRDEDVRKDELSDLNS